MIEGIGVDIELIKRFKKKKINKNFLSLVFTEREKEYCERKKEPHISYAGKFCAKESVIKSLGKRIPFCNIEIINDPNGQPQVYIEGKKDKRVKCSISHSGEYAIACAVINKNGK